MNAGTQPRKKSAGTTFLSATYAVTLLMMALTGFGQLPIYKRYYVSDIPSLGTEKEMLGPRRPVIPHAEKPDHSAVEAAESSCAEKK